jgi:hypothetical protein
VNRDSGWNLPAATNERWHERQKLRDRFWRRHLPIISVDSKKRELVGNFKNPGRRWESAPRRVSDHDFRTDSNGVAIPYGIYDVRENRGAMVVGVSHDTPTW